MKIEIFLVVLILISVFCMASAAAAQTMTAAQRQALIAQITQQLAQLQAQVAQIIAQRQTTLWCHTFDNNLGYLNSGTDEVVSLHLFLQKENISYSPDNINVYSTGTSQGVIQFQSKYGISPLTGYVGPKTRAKLNQLYGCSPNNQIVNQTNGCQARCLTQSDGVYAIDCSGGVIKCDPSEICQTTHDISYTYNNNLVQTIRTLTGAQCVVSCIPNWRCSDFSACFNSQQTRACNDTNNCGTTTGRPDLTQVCSACVANCLAQSGGLYAVDCSGGVTKCDSGQICQRNYDTTYTYNNGSIQTSQTLTGAVCETPDY